MVLVDRLPQTGTHYVRVNLCRSNIHVAQHRLYATEIRTAFKQMRCKRVPQNMRAQFPEDADSLPMPPQQLPETLARHACSARRHKQVRTHLTFQQSRPPRQAILPHRCNRF
jgi:hypothetical protein